MTSKKMRPLTESEFKKRCQYLVGPRWNESQVRQAYEKADDLLDYLTEWKIQKPTKGCRQHSIPSCFEAGLKLRLSRNLPNKSVQKLSLSVLRELWLKGDDLLQKAAWLYKYHPKLFREDYASSRQAFLKDKFLLNTVPFYSFPSFATSRNPVLNSDPVLSRKYALLDSDPIFESRAYFAYLSDTKKVSPYQKWLETVRGKKFTGEYIWLHSLFCKIQQESRQETGLFASLFKKQSKQKG